MDRSGWDHKGIGKMVEESKGTESLAAGRLNEALKKYIKEKSLTNLQDLHVFDRNTKKERREAKDLDIIIGDKILHGIEVECFSQAYWDNSLPAIKHRWPYGLSILYRKIETANRWKFFLKISQTANSFFSCEKDWLFGKYDEGLIGEDSKGKLIRDGREVKTCVDRWLIPWDLAEKSMGDSGFVSDDWNKLAGMVCNFVTEKIKAEETKTEEKKEES